MALKSGLAFPVFFPVVFPVVFLCTYIGRLQPRHTRAYLPRLPAKPVVTSSKIELPPIIRYSIRFASRKLLYLVFRVNHLPSELLLTHWTSTSKFKYDSKASLSLIKSFLSLFISASKSHRFFLEVYSQCLQAFGDGRSSDRIVVARKSTCGPEVSNEYSPGFRTRRYLGRIDVDCIQRTEWDYALYCSSTSRYILDRHLIAEDDSWYG